MRFSHDLDYDAPPAAVHAMLADPAFRAQACEAMHASRHEVSIDGAAAAMTVLVDQTQPARGIPAFARTVVGDELRIIQRETWAGPTAATVNIELPGKPGGFEGTIALGEAGGGTRETVAGEVRVKVPLIGGRLEQLVAELLAAALRAEHRVGCAYLTSR